MSDQPASSAPRGRSGRRAAKVFALVAVLAVTVFVGYGRRDADVYLWLLRNLRDPVGWMLLPVSPYYQRVIENRTVGRIRAAARGSDAAGVAETRKVLRDGDTIERFYALMFFRGLPAKVRANALPELLDLLENSNDGLTNGPVAECLWDLGPAGAPAVPRLGRIAAGGDTRRRLVAARTLAQIGPDAASASPQVAAAFRGEESWAVREELFGYLERLDRREAAAVAAELASDKDEEARAFGADALRRLAPPAVGAEAGDER